MKKEMGTDFETEYGKIAKKYKLPSYQKLNEDFEIGKIENNAGTIVRTVRKVMMEKIVNSLGFLEMLLNPVNVPRVYFAYLKSITAEDKKNMEKIYEELSMLSLLALEREVKYSEKGEAELVVKISKSWDSIKNSFEQIARDIRKPNHVAAAKKEKSYFE